MQLPPPYPPGSRGPEPAITPHEAAALLVIKVHFDLAFRDLELYSDALLGRHVDHNVFNKHIDRIPPEYVSKVNALLDEEIRGLLTNVAWAFLTDSTKAGLDRQYETRTIALQETRVAKVEQLHVLGSYAREVGVLTVTRAHAGIMGESDAAQGMLADTPDDLVRGRPLFGDRGYDDGELFRDAFERDMLPLIKQRDTGTSRGYRGMAQRVWDLEAYRATRGLVEGIFGGIETRHSLHSRCRKPRNQQRETLAMAVSHNLQALLRVLTFREVGLPAAS